MAKKSTQISGLASQDMLLDEPGSGVTTTGTGWSTGRISGRMIRKVGYHPDDDDYDGPTREQEEGMSFERALWIKAGPNPRFKGKR